MGQSDNRAGSKIWSNFDAGRASGVKLHNGTYVGVVKNVDDPERIGRLQVWLPDLGGIEDDDNNWQTVRYASPFMGSTDTRGAKNKKATEENFVNNGATYGMWMVPPDIGNQVLCTFINGDTNRGFWFACILDRKGQYSLPSHSGGEYGVDFDVKTVQSNTLRNSIYSASKKGKVYMPLTEFNPFVKSAQDPLDRKKVVHEYLAIQYFEQGLHSDPVRGARRASAQRDMPSQVYGISTPGKPAGRIPGTTRVPAGQSVYEREGGNALVLDDGDFNGAGAHIKLRSGAGNQILMDDDTGSIYVINASGSAWFEMAESGQVFMYASGGINMRTRGNFNLHSDETVRIFGGKGVQIRSDGDFIMEGKKNFTLTGGDELFLFGDKKVVVLSEKGQIQLNAVKDVSIKGEDSVKIDAGSNVGSSVKINEQKAEKAPKAPKGLALYERHPDSVQDGSGAWAPAVGKYVTSICPIVPTHEPWDRGGYDEATRQQTNQAIRPAPTFSTTGSEPRQLPGGYSTSIDPNAIGGSAGTGQLSDTFLQRNPGVANARKNNNLPNSAIPRANSFNAQTVPKASAPIGTLSKDEVSSLFIGIAMRETSGDGDPRGSDYGVRNQFGYAGRYQFGQAALEEVGLMKTGTSARYPGNKGMDRTDTWNLDSGMKDFLTSPGVQEKAMQDLTTKNYQTLVKAGVIGPDSPPDHVAGMLAVAHNLGAGGAINWARTGTGADGNKVPGSQYYNVGKAAINNSYSSLYNKG